MKLKENLRIETKSNVAHLYIFLDDNRIMRVCSRLQFANIECNQKLPMILKKSHQTDLIIEKTHLKTLYGEKRNRNIYKTLVLDQRTEKFRKTTNS